MDQENSCNYYRFDSEPSEIWLNKEYLVQLNLTGNCSLNCDFCYIKEYQNTFLSLNDIKKLWENLRKYSKTHGITYRVNITGGDIFNHPEWKEIAKFIIEEKTIEAVDPLLNSFWKEEHLELLSILKRKINFIQFNSDVVKEEDISAARKIGKYVVLKVSLYKGSFKKNIDKIKKLTDKFDNILVGVDVIIPQKNGSLKNQFIVKDLATASKMINELKTTFGEKFWLSSSTFKRMINNEVYFCPVPFGGVYIMPDKRIVPCSRYSHLETGFTTDNFDLIEYVSKFNKLCSNFCLFENKYFEDFWDKSQNPINF